LGGDDGSQVRDSPENHRGFSRQILRYEARANRWTKAGETPAPRVTAAAVHWNQTWVIPSGELRPGIRSTEVWSWTPARKD
jgi:N-acetylneuraminic acid mutarotase